MYLCPCHIKGVRKICISLDIAYLPCTVLTLFQCSYCILADSCAGLATVCLSTYCITTCNLALVFVLACTQCIDCPIPTTVASATLVAEPVTKRLLCL